MGWIGERSWWGGEVEEKARGGGGRAEWEEGQVAKWGGGRGEALVSNCRGPVGRERHGCRLFTNTKL